MARLEFWKQCTVISHVALIISLTWWVAACKPSWSCVLTQKVQGSHLWWRERGPSQSQTPSPRWTFTPWAQGPLLTQRQYWDGGGFRASQLIPKVYPHSWTSFSFFFLQALEKSLQQSPAVRPGGLRCFFPFFPYFSWLAFSFWFLNFFFFSQSKGIDFFMFFKSFFCMRYQGNDYGKPKWRVKESQECWISFSWSFMFL